MKEIGCGSTETDPLSQRATQGRHTGAMRTVSTGRSKRLGRGITAYQRSMLTQVRTAGSAFARSRRGCNYVSLACRGKKEGERHANIESRYIRLYSWRCSLAILSGQPLNAAPTVIDFEQFSGMPFENPAPVPV